MTAIDALVDLDRHPLDDPDYRDRCRAALDAQGALVLEGFLRPGAVADVCAEGAALESAAFWRPQAHNVYLCEPEPGLDAEHPRNRQVQSSKGCLTDDQLAYSSPLKQVYRSPAVQDFFCAVLGIEALHAYADPLSSVNLHFARTGEELGWHFDNSDFAITLLVQSPQDGGVFEYVPALRDADAGEMNYDGVAAVLDGHVRPVRAQVGPGDLMLFRGRNALHRVTPTIGERTRMLAVLAYNERPGVSLSESARMTFYGRLG